MNFFTARPLNFLILATLSVTCLGSANAADQDIERYCPANKNYDEQSGQENQKLMAALESHQKASPTKPIVNLAKAEMKELQEQRKNFCGRYLALREQANKIQPSILQDGSSNMCAKQEAIGAVFETMSGDMAALRADLRKKQSEMLEQDVRYREANYSAVREVKSDQKSKHLAPQIEGDATKIWGSAGKEAVMRDLLEGPAYLDASLQKMQQPTESMAHKYKDMAAKCTTNGPAGAGKVPPKKGELIKANGL